MLSCAAWGETAQIGLKNLMLPWDEVASGLVDGFEKVALHHCLFKNYNNKY